jgi:virginiamycin B lyase
MIMQKALPITFASLLCAVSQAVAQGQRPQPIHLPDGPGKQIVEVMCSQCHGLNMITNSGGYTREGWKHVFSSMVAFRGQRGDTVAAYLAEHFPVKPRPEAVVIPGTAKVTIREWLVPTLGQRPHDPLWAADGSIWWTGQYANLLGRLDPRTGAMREYELKTPDSNPHGLIADRTATSGTPASQEIMSANSTR